MFVANTQLQTELNKSLNSKVVIITLKALKVNPEPSGSVRPRPSHCFEHGFLDPDQCFPRP